MLRDTSTISAALGRDIFVVADSPRVGAPAFRRLSHSPTFDARNYGPQLRLRAGFLFKPQEDWMTDRQIAASRAHIDALRAYRNAAPGERTKTKRRLEAAAVEILAAHNEATRIKHDVADTHQAGAAHV